jgi:hypothetical protein
VIAVVTKTLSPQTIGDDHATPGIFVFHWTFLSVLHSVGIEVAETTPEPFGPRNCDHSSAKAARRQVVKQNPSTMIHFVRMMVA